MFKYNDAISMTLPNLRSIFAASRSPPDERKISRISFTNFIIWLVSCAGIAFRAASASASGQGRQLR